MKKLISLTLALATILLTLASCKPTQGTTFTPPSTPTATQTDEGVENTIAADSFILSKSFCVYNSFVFYTSENYDFPENKTLKYQNLNKLQENGVPVYNNAFGGEDPFVGIGNIEIIVDDEATKENGGLPVLIISKQYAEIEPSIGQSRIFSRIVKFDQGSNKLTEIFKSDEGMYIDGMCLYGDTLFFKSWGKDDKGEETYAYHSINKNGKDYETAEFAGPISSYLGIHNDIIYLRDITGKVYSTDLEYNDFKLVYDATISSVIMIPKISGRYLYYADNIRETEVNGLKVKCGDLCRKSLDNFNNAEAEVLIEGITDASVSNGNIAYALASEGKPEEITLGENNEFKYVVNRSPIIRLYDLRTGNQKIAINNSNDPDAIVRSSFLELEGNYVIMTVQKPDANYTYYSYYNISTDDTEEFPFYCK